jgi:hypothetical protein
VIANAILFIAFAVILCAATVLGWLGLGQIALSGSSALERDGLGRGQRAPTWTLTDSAGMTHSSPPGGQIQLIVFADHSLKSFPSVVAGLRALRSGPADLEIVIVTRGASEGAAAMLSQIGLDGIPVLTGSPAIYAAYNVRVMPFAIFVDSAGLVRASSLVNHDWQVAKLGQIAGIPFEPDEGVRAPHSTFKLAV